MGIYLAKPSTDISLEAGADDALAFAVGEMQGWRRNMEDAHIALSDITNTSIAVEEVEQIKTALRSDGRLSSSSGCGSSGSDSSQLPISLFGVFDGHGGKEVAKFVKLKYPRLLLQLLAEQKCEDVGAILRESFHKIDELLEDEQYTELLKELRAMPNPSDLEKERFAREEEEAEERERGRVESEQTTIAGFANGGTFRVMLDDDVDDDGDDGDDIDDEGDDVASGVEDADQNQSEEVKAALTAVDDELRQLMSIDADHNHSPTILTRKVVGHAHSAEASKGGSTEDTASSLYAAVDAADAGSSRGGKESSINGAKKDVLTTSEAVDLIRSVLQKASSKRNLKAVGSDSSRSGSSAGGDQRADNGGDEGGSEGSDEDCGSDSARKYQVVSTRFVGGVDLLEDAPSVVPLPAAGLATDDIGVGASSSSGEGGGDGVRTFSMLKRSNSLTIKVDDDCSSSSSGRSSSGGSGGSGGSSSSSDDGDDDKPTRNRNRSLSAAADGDSIEARLKGRPMPEPASIQTGQGLSCNLKPHRIPAGCTAVVALLIGCKIYCANAGDSRGVLCREDGTAFALSYDHKPSQDRELNRITEAGGFVNLVGRINGNLNLSRSLGDLKYKQLYHLPREAQIITAEPDITVTEIAPGDQFFILACDGIWDCLSNQEACDFVRERLKKGLNAEQITKQVLEHCLSDDPRLTSGVGGDNMTFLLVLLNKTAEACRRREMEQELL